MIVGVPREVKSDEYRVAMLPVGVEELTRRGHRVLIEHGAGLGSGILDEQYAIHGAEIVPDAGAVFREAATYCESERATTLRDCSFSAGADALHVSASGRR